MANKRKKRTAEKIRPNAPKMSRGRATGWMKASAVKIERKGGKTNVLIRQPRKRKR